MLAFLPLLLLASCTTDPQDRVLWRESWEMVALTDDGMVMDARLVIGNTGLLKRQGHLTVDFISPTTTPLQVRRDLSPSAIARDPSGQLLTLLTNELQMTDRSWTLLVREGQKALDATVVLADDIVPHGGDRPSWIEPVALVEGDARWEVSAPVPAATLAGAWRSGDLGGILRGYGVATYAAGDVPPDGDVERQDVTAAGPHWAFGIRTLGDAGLAWFADDRGIRTSRSVSLRRDGDRIKISLQPQLAMDATLDLKAAGLVTQVWKHLLFFESWIVGLAWSPPDRETRLASIRIHGLKSTWEGHGVWVRTGTLRPEGPPRQD